MLAASASPSFGHASYASALQKTGKIRAHFLSSFFPSTFFKGSREIHSVCETTNEEWSSQQARIGAFFAMSDVEIFREIETTKVQTKAQPEGLPFA